MKEKQTKNDRIKFLKQAKLEANQYLEENKAAKHSSKGWKLKTIEKNIFQLKSEIRKINKQLTEATLNSFVEADKKSQAYWNNQSNKTSFDFRVWGQRVAQSHMSIKLLRHSLSYSVAFDLYWIEDGTVGDQIAIAKREKSPEILGEYLKSKLQFTEKEILPFLKKDYKYASIIRVIKTAIKESKKRSYLTSNILLITGIESLVRTLCKFVYKQQNPNLSAEEIEEYIYEKFLSLESLISKGNWKEDLLIDLPEAILLNEYILDDSLSQAEEIKRKHQEAQNEINGKLDEMETVLKSQHTNKIEENAKNILKEHLFEIRRISEEKMINQDEKIVPISLKTRMQFLLRGFKEDRNQLIHGNFNDFDKKWKNYVYYSALKKVFELIKDYTLKYATA